MSRTVAKRRIRATDERVAIAVADLVHDAGMGNLPPQIAPFLSAVDEALVSGTATVADLPAPVKQRLARSFLYVSRFLALARQHPRRAARIARGLPPRHCPCGHECRFAECCQIPLSFLLRVGGAQEIWPNILISASARVRVALSNIGAVPMTAILTAAYALCLQGRYRDVIQIVEAITRGNCDLSSAEATFACTLVWMSYERLGDVGGHRKLTGRLLRTQLRSLKAQGWLGLARRFWAEGDMRRFRSAQRRALAEDPCISLALCSPGPHAQCGDDRQEGGMKRR